MKIDNFVLFSTFIVLKSVSYASLGIFFSSSAMRMITIFIFFLSLIVSLFGKQRREDEDIRFQQRKQRRDLSVEERDGQRERKGRDGDRRGKNKTLGMRRKKATS